MQSRESGPQELIIVPFGDIWLINHVMGLWLQRHRLSLPASISACANHAISHFRLSA